jgi:hypothetical protein
MFISLPFTAPASHMIIAQHTNTRNTTRGKCTCLPTRKNLSQQLSQHVATSNPHKMHQALLQYASLIQSSCPQSQWQEQFTVVDCVTCHQAATVKSITCKKLSVSTLNRYEGIQCSDPFNNMVMSMYVVCTVFHRKYLIFSKQHCVNDLPTTIRTHLSLTSLLI